MPGGRYDYPVYDNGYWGNSFDAATDWFTPVVDPQDQQTAVGLLDRPVSTPYPAGDHPSFPPGALEITPTDAFEALGTDADELLASADIDVDELIQLIKIGRAHV